jgi:hypothetical protein
VERNKREKHFLFLMQETGVMILRKLICASLPSYYQVSSSKLTMVEIFTHGNQQ